MSNKRKEAGWDVASSSAGAVMVQEQGRSRPLCTAGSTAVLMDSSVGGKKQGNSLMPPPPPLRRQGFSSGSVRNPYAKSKPSLIRSASSIGKKPPGSTTNFAQRAATIPPFPSNETSKQVAVAVAVTVAAPPKDNSVPRKNPYTKTIDVINHPQPTLSPDMYASDIDWNAISLDVSFNQPQQKQCTILESSKAIEKTKSKVKACHQQQNCCDQYDTFEIDWNEIPLDSSPIPKKIRNESSDLPSFHSSSKSLSSISNTPMNKLEVVTGPSSLKETFCGFKDNPVSNSESSFHTHSTPQVHVPYQPKTLPQFDNDNSNSMSNSSSNNNNSRIHRKAVKLSPPILDTIAVVTAASKTSDTLATNPGSNNATRSNQTIEPMPLGVMTAPTDQAAQRRNQHWGTPPPEKVPDTPFASPKKPTAAYHPSNSKSLPSGETSRGNDQN